MHKDADIELTQRVCGQSSWRKFCAVPRSTRWARAWRRPEIVQVEVRFCPAALSRSMSSSPAMESRGTKAPAKRCGWRRRRCGL